jgi:lipopolysaccharide export LptBFGC system permease protein LptF
VPFLVALLLGAGAVWLARVGEPWGLSELNRVLDAVIKRNLETGLLPGVFNDGLPRFMIYVEKREGQGSGETSGTGEPGALPRWRHVLLEDRTGDGPPLLALAEEGRIVDEGGDGGDVLTLELRRGELHRPEEHGEVVARFDKASLGVGVRVPLKMKNRLANSEAAIPGERLEEYALQREAEGQPHLAARARLEKVRRAAVPLSCLAFLLLAVPLSLVSGGARGAAYVSTLLAFALFYVLGRAGLVMAERGGPLWLAGFLPDLVVAGSGLVLTGRLLWRGVGSAR